MPETGSLAAALVQLQANLPPITKDDTAQVGPRTYAYANLATIHAAILPLLASLGLYWTTCPTLMDGQFVLDYALTHVSGGSIGGQYPLPASGTPQQVGSAITYAKRYTICAVLGIAPAEDDDDGQAAEAAAKPSYEDRVAAGRMDRTQSREHGNLANLADTHPRPADRMRGPLPDDEWTARAPEASPGSSLPAQRQAIGRLAARLGAASDHDRHVLIGKALGTGEIIGAKDLSARQASDVIKWMQDQIGADR
jgi:hypothetical protein